MEFDGSLDKDVEFKASTPGVDLMPHPEAACHPHVHQVKSKDATLEKLSSFPHIKAAAKESLAEAVLC